MLLTCLIAIANLFLYKQKGENVCKGNGMNTFRCIYYIDHMLITCSVKPSGHQQSREGEEGETQFMPGVELLNLKTSKKKEKLQWCNDYFLKKTIYGYRHLTFLLFLVLTVTYKHDNYLAYCFMFLIDIRWWTNNVCTVQPLNQLWSSNLCITFMCTQYSLSVQVNK